MMARNGDIATLRGLLVEGRVDVNITDEVGASFEDAVAIEHDVMCYDVIVSHYTGTPSLIANCYALTFHKPTCSNVLR